MKDAAEKMTKTNCFVLFFPTFFSFGKIRIKNCYRLFSPCCKEKKRCGRKKGEPKTKKKKKKRTIKAFREEWGL